MRVVIAGVGKAGGALAIAAARAGHGIVGLYGRTPRLDPDLPAPIVGYDTLTVDRPLPSADLLVIGCRDHAIGGLATRLAPLAGEVRSAVHLSGFVPVAALSDLDERGLLTGSFHPLQSLPGPLTGADALAGSWVAVTAGPPLSQSLDDLAASLGMTPFPLADAAKSAYHAGAAAASNYVIASLDLAASLFESAGVAFEALRPLTTAAVANAFAAGPQKALTGPIARGDWATVEGHLTAAAALGQNRLHQARWLAAATAVTAGVQMPAVLEPGSEN
jgi:predicted short-subunit dehydrogenase-like oxidoreductase (DUF2520 family)